MRSRARVSASFYKAFERMRRALRINPGAVFFVYIKRRRRPRRDSGPTLTLGGQKTVSDCRWLQIDQSLPLLHHRVDRTDAIRKIAAVSESRCGA